MNKKQLLVVVFIFMVGVIVSIVFRACTQEDNVYNNCNQEETTGIDIDIEDVDIFIMNNKKMDLATTND